MLLSIISANETDVKPRTHIRIHRAEIPVSQIDPTLKAFGRHVARQSKKRRGVHIPAMKNGDFGHVLRTLELKRAII